MLKSPTVLCLFLPIFEQSGHYSMCRQPTYHISLSPLQIDFIVSCFRECLWGASSTEIQRTSGVPVLQTAAFFEDHFADAGKFELGAITSKDWRMVYEVINGCIYGLGQNELTTLTGFELSEAINANLLITAKRWGVYEGGKY